MKHAMTHLISLRETWLEGDDWHEYQPRCACGWVGTITMRPIPAHSEGLQHLRGEL